MSWSLTVVGARLQCLQRSVSDTTAAAARRRWWRPSAAEAAEAAEAAHWRSSSSHSSHSMSLEQDKGRLREEVKAALRQMTEEQMAAESALIVQRLLGLPAFQAAPHAVIYVHCARLREVDTGAALRAAWASGKRLYAPRVQQDQAAHMRFLHLDSLDALQAPAPPFGIREPHPTYGDGRQRDDVLLIDEPLELVVMPGLAFDAAGRRLGRGGGYYDKFVSAARRRAEQHGWAPPLLVALAFRCQVVQGGGGGGDDYGGGVPVEPHDASVDAIVTADGVMACSPAGAAAVAAAEAAEAAAEAAEAAAAQKQQ